MSRPLRILTLILMQLLPISAYAQAADGKAWTLYVAISPGSADVFNYAYADGKLDIRKFKYPLYVGYLYTTDSKSIRWKSFQPFVEPAMSSWAEQQNEVNGGVAIDPTTPFKYKGKKWVFTFEDDEYVEVAPMPLFRRGLAVIKTVRGQLPDDSWRPKFNHQYAIDFDFDNSTAYQLDFIMQNDRDAWEVTN